LKSIYSRSKQYYRELYHTNKTNPGFKEKARANNLKWRQNNQKKYLLQHARSRAKEMNVFFDLIEEDIIVPELCPILGTPFQYGTRYSASVDRIDPRGSYTKNNIQIISWKANAMKQDASPEELRKFGEWALSQYTS
jgi:hypothetical protein